MMNNVMKICLVAKAHNMLSLVRNNLEWKGGLVVCNVSKISETMPTLGKKHMNNKRIDSTHS